MEGGSVQEISVIYIQYTCETEKVLSKLKVLGPGREYSACLACH